MPNLVILLLIGPIFLTAVLTSIDSFLWKIIWIGIAVALWYFVGIYAAAPLMIIVIVGVAVKKAIPPQSKV